MLAAHRLPIQQSCSLRMHVIMPDSKTTHGVKLRLTCLASALFKNSTQPSEKLLPESEPSFLRLACTYLSAAQVAQCCSHTELSSAYCRTLRRKVEAPKLAILRQHVPHFVGLLHSQPACEPSCMPKNELHACQGP